MPAIFEHRLVVGDWAIDPQGHASNIEYLRWMQDAAVAHSDAQGWTAEKYREIGGTWFVRSHQIEYLKPALLGDEVILKTWVASLERVRSSRKFEFLRGEEAIAHAETLWVWVETSSGRPRPVPPAVAAAFEVIEEIS